MSGNRKSPDQIGATNFFRMSPAMLSCICRLTRRACLAPHSAVADLRPLAEHKDNKPISTPIKKRNISPPGKILPELALFLIFLLTAPAGHTANLALDRASDVVYNDGWQAGDNGGYGWGAGWGFSGSSFFIGDSASNGSGDTPPLGDINTNGRAWGIRTTGPTAAFRLFDGALSLGQRCLIDVDTGFVDSSGFSGFSLITSSGADLLRFYYVGGNAQYTVEAGSVIGTLPNFTDQGLHIEFTLTGPGTYSMSINPLGGQATIVTGSLLSNTLPIEAIQIYNQPIGQGADHNGFFNNIAIVPEPSIKNMLVIGFVLSIQMRPKRRS